MRTTLNANFLYSQVNNDIDVLIIGFADDEFDTEEYVLLQRSLNPTNEDKELGYDKVHITYNDESQSLYGGIKKFFLKRNLIEITLEQEVSEILNCHNVIEITFCIGKDEVIDIHNYLIKMFSNENSIYHFDI
jgi:hypothetical protein